jgi:diguanylate cyclase (GGDEF)-like protein
MTRLRRFTSAQIFGVLIAAFGLAVFRAITVRAGLDLKVFTQLSVLLLTAGVLLGELLPLKIPRRGDDEEITISTSFSFALLLTAGFAPAALAQSTASVLQDIGARKPLWRIAFNIGQYTLSLAAAWSALQLLSATPDVVGHHFGAPEIPELVAAAAVFFVVNTGIVGVIIALYQDMAIADYFRSDLAFSAATGAVLLSLSPIMVAALDSSPAVFPLFVFPLLAVFYGGREAARSEHQATHDALTRLPNRVRFHDLVGRAIKPLAKDERVAVLLMDLNRFKDINDTLGHHYGDLLLEQVALRLQGPLRDGDVVARLGGDEFGVLLAELPHVGVAADIADRLHRSLEQSFEVDGFMLEIDVSIGIARYPEDGTDVETLLQRADVAMYRAKECHAPYLTYSKEYDHHTPERLALVADLRRAIDAENELVVWYEPKLQLQSAAVTSVEGLVRWQHPTLGLLQPSAFIEMAEHTGLIKPLTLLVIDRALGQCQDWREQGLDLEVAVNLSARALADRRFPTEVTKLIAKWGLPPDRLKFEITESSIMADPPAALWVIEQLHAAEISLAIDDFGTGYSSLAMLKQLPVSQIKIDKSFVMNMAASKDDSLIVRSTIELGHNLGLEVVAEGVEDRASLAELERLGCDLVQGYHLSPPLSAEQLERWLRGREQWPGATTHSPRSSRSQLRVISPTEGLTDFAEPPGGAIESA